MHIKDLSYIIILFTVLTSSCSKSSPKISIGCEENAVGNNIIKWEVTPKIDGVVKIYASNTPNDFKSDIPIGVANINDQRIVIVNNDPTTRKFYKIVFNDTESTIITSRNININNVQNFRDLGGYRVFSTNQGGKWGHIFRSGNLELINHCGISRLKKLGIKTIVDLDPSETKNEFLVDQFNYISVPIFSKNFNHYLRAIYKGEVNRERINNQIQHVYRNLISNYTAEYKQIFNILLNKKNYPIVFECAAGKEQIGIVSFLILTSLGVDVQTAKLDYLRTNQFIDISEASRYASKLPQSAQEALTALMLAQNEYIDAAIKEMKQSYGSIEGYLTEGIGLSKSDINELRSILLHN